MTLVEATLKSRFVPDLPEYLVGDRAYDSDRLDKELEEKWGVFMVAPHRKNRKKPKTQDGRELRRIRKRWNIERLFAWTGWFRRTLVRHEYYPENFLGFIHLAFILILFRHS